MPAENHTLKTELQVEDVPDDLYGSLNDTVMPAQAGILSFINEFREGRRAQFRSSTLVGQKHAILADNGIGVISYFMAHFEPILVSVLPGLSAEERYGSRTILI